MLIIKIIFVIRFVFTLLMILIGPIFWTDIIIKLLNFLIFEQMFIDHWWKGNILILDNTTIRNINDEIFLYIFLSRGVFFLLIIQIRIMRVGIDLIM